MRRQTIMTQSVKTWGRRTFSSLQIYNFRLYFIGQGISLWGTWLQTIGQTWLVLQMTHSGTAVGLVTAFQFLPILLFGPLGGVLVDRFSKRKLIVITQIWAALLALTLAVLVSAHQLQVWMIYALAAGLGLANSVASPGRQTFMLEMVGEAHVTNAISLNSAMVNLARVIGPALAAVLISRIGYAPCFYLNAASYLAVLASLGLVRTSELHPNPPSMRIRGQLREGLRYVWHTPVLRDTLLMMAFIGTLSYEFQVSLPLLASHTFHGGVNSYALLTSAMSAGAVIGGLVTATRKKVSPARMSTIAAGLGISILTVAIAPTMVVAVALLVPLGALSIAYTALTNTTLQLNSAPHMRGRVMALWSVAFLGSTPIGGPLIGWISEHSNPRWSLVVGGLAAVLAGGLGLVAMHGKRFAAKRRDKVLHPAMEDSARIVKG
ncbi:MAG TPA: MFS transporter [Candidatus Saccharimonadales bacterium]|nr:MFS transporter [Candidatus Saccharimonadales bacterium]